MPVFHNLVIILSLLISSTIQSIHDNELDKGIHQKENEKFSKNLDSVGGMVSNFLQSDSGKKILKKIGTAENLGKVANVLGNLMNNDASEANSKSGTNSADEINPLDILSALGSLSGSLSQTNDDADNSGSNPNDILQGIGSLLVGEGGNNVAEIIQGVGSILSSGEEENPKSRKTKEAKVADGGGGGDGGAALLAGIGSLLAASAGKQSNSGSGILGIISGLLSQGQGQGQNGINVELIGNLIKTFASLNGDEKNDDHQKLKRKKVKENYQEKKIRKKTRNENSAGEFNLGDIINLATTFLSQGTGGGGGLDYTHYLSMIMNTINAFTGPDAEERAHSHLGHAKTTPSIFESFHLFFDNFLHSDMAKQILNYVGDEKAFKVFKNKNGDFEYEKFEELIENHSFRKHWIKQIAGRLVDFLKVLSTKKAQNEYVLTGLTFANSYLKANGFPSSALINLNSPVQSLTNFGNYVARKYLNLENVDTKIYVEPSVMYVEELLSSARNSLTANEEPIELIDQISDTINLEVIEPIVRVNRAYRFIKLQPKCDRYVLCLINQQVPSTDSLPAVKKWLSKGPSLIAAWFLSTHTGTSYWSLYSDIIEDKNCQRYYHKNCEGFHDEEIKVTTEYIHSEL